MMVDDPVSPSTAIGGRPGSRMLAALTARGSATYLSLSRSESRVSAIQRVVDRGDSADAGKATWSVLHCGDQGRVRGMA